MNNSFKIYPVLLFSLMLLNSCRDVINLDLNSSNPKIVIEGQITDASGPYTVKISKTTDYFNPTIPPSVTGAKIVISDNLGNQDSLVEQSSGVYLTQKLKGTIGRTYTMRVVAEGKEFTAQSTMPNLVPIDSLGFQDLSFGNVDSGTLRLLLYFKDPPGITNDYRIRVFKNGVLQNNIITQSNRRFVGDGDMARIPLGNNNIRFKKGDVATVELWSIDKSVYDYFITLNETLSSGNGPGGGSSAPSNPDSNIQGGALGFFGAIAVSSKTYVFK